MSRAFSGWILKAVNGRGVSPLLPLLHPGEKRSYSQCLTGRGQARWRPARPAPSPPARPYRHPAEDVGFQLLPEQVDSALRANEQSCEMAEGEGRGRGTLLKFESNILPSNTPCEDRRAAAACLQTKGHLFGVFDGHAGAACAQTVSERLFYYIAVALMPQATLEEIEAAHERARPVLPILQWQKHRNDYGQREIAAVYVDHLRVFWQELIDLDNEGGKGAADAMAYAFRRLDSDISLEAQVADDDGAARNLALQIAFSGATACVCHVDGVHLHVANAGDCRAVLGVQDAAGWSAVPLTADHNAFNPSELRRVRSEHPRSEAETVVADERLLGVLMPLRAFGDVRFKWSEELQRSVLRGARDAQPLNLYPYHPAHCRTPPYLTAAPEVTYHQLRPRDRFLVMASDGLWDALGDREAVRLVAEHLSEERAPRVSVEKRSLGTMHNLLLERRSRRAAAQDRNVATHLIRHAVGTNEDGEVDQERLAAVLSMPEDLSRMYRDDITVTVIFFNAGAVQAHYRDGVLKEGRRPSRTEIH
ncbi:pyruvate dehydrogenase [acetyl-transferring]-phosphatase 2, mitochondrial [Mantella aurantiaca]